VLSISATPSSSTVPMRRRRRQAFQRMHPDGERRCDRSTAGRIGTKVIVLPDRPLGTARLVEGRQPIADRAPE
jgi:hypothetical protein